MFWCFCMEGCGTEECAMRKNSELCVSRWWIQIWGSGTTEWYLCELWLSALHLKAMVYPVTFLYSFKTDYFFKTVNLHLTMTVSLFFQDSKFTLDNDSVHDHMNLSLTSSFTFNIMEQFTTWNWSSHIQLYLQHYGNDLPHETDPLILCFTFDSKGQITSWIRLSHI